LTGSLQKYVQAHAHYTSTNSNQDIQRSSDDVLSENAKLKAVFEDLKRKIADKNHYIQKAEYDKKDLEVAYTELSAKHKELERDLKKMKEQNEKLLLRCQRGAPYYQVIQQYFPNDI